MAEPFLTVMKISLWGALLLAMPVILWQLWAFFAPAVEPGAERRVRTFVLFASVLLVAGVVFGYFVALPAAVHYLTNYDKQVFNIQIRAADYYSFVTMVLIAMAVVFELPVFVLALSGSGSSRRGSCGRTGAWATSSSPASALRSRDRPRDDGDRDHSALVPLRTLDLAGDPRREAAEIASSSATLGA